MERRYIKEKKIFQAIVSQSINTYLAISNSSTVINVSAVDSELN